MLSLSNGGMTSSQAGGYFAREDYYLKGQEASRWLGKGAATLKLEGIVQEGDFRNITAGKSPDGRLQLVTPKIVRGDSGEQIETHRAGNDLTFSAPKSVSIGYAAGDVRLKEIWDRAVVNTMQEVERHYSQYATPDGLKTAGNLLAAKFDHVTSRSLDPEVHSHVFLVNMVQVRGKGWQANDPKNIYQDKITIGMMARSDAIRLYRQAGYGIRFTDREQLLFEIEGVRQEEIEAFSKRSRAIAEKVAEWREKGLFPGVPEATLKAMAALETRDPKRQVTQEDVRREWGRGFAAAGTTPDEVLQRIGTVRSKGPHFLSPGSYPPTLATVINQTNLVTLKRQPGYSAAKKLGDGAAAMRIVDKLVKPGLIEEIRSQIPEGSDVYVVPVLQKEGPRLNMLPLAYATRLAEELGGEVWLRIGKVSGRPNTGASAQERAHNVQVFRGEVPPKNSIIIVADDTLTAGGTLTALIDHLAQGDNIPVIATTLAVGRYGKNLTPTKEQIDGLLRKAGVSEEQFRDVFGYAPKELTGTEIRSYLFSGGRGVDGASARLYTKGSGRSPGSDEAVPEGKPPLPEKRAAEIIKAAAGALTEKEVVFHRGALTKTAVQISGGEHPLAELAGAIDQSGTLRFLGEETRGWRSGREFFTTSEMLALEARNIARLQALPTVEKLTTKSEIQAYLKGVAGETPSPEESSHLAAYQAGARSAREQGAVVLSPGQTVYIMNELAGEKGFAVTQGDPGTGKTFAAGIVERFGRDVLEPSGRGHRTVNLAYTGKATLEMAAATGGEADTIDSFLAHFKECRDRLAAYGRVTIRVDEASFVGGRQAAAILDAVDELREAGAAVKISLIGDAKQLQSIQASPFFIHATNLARDGYGEYGVMKEIGRQKDAGLLAVAQTLNREEGSRGNAADALKMLEQQGRVVEIAAHDRLMQETIRRYLAEAAKVTPGGGKQSVLVVTPLNRDRQELNEKIRLARQERGELGEGVRVTVLVPAGQGVTTESYRPGMTVILAAAKGEKISEGEVTGTDPVRNLVMVRFKGKSGVFGAAELGTKATLYRREERSFAAGDQVVFVKNSKGRAISSPDGGKRIGVRNGERGEVEEIVTEKGETRAAVKLEDGRRVTVELTRFGPQHIDHGYAVTIHKAQGESVDSVLYFNEVKTRANERGALRHLTGVEASAEEFGRWNRELSEFEKRYRGEARIGEHKASVSFTIITEREMTAQKGIALRFSDGKGVIGDEEIRSRMREAGIQWSKENGVWVTPATNRKAMALIDRHPLQDPAYRKELQEELHKGPPVPAAPVSKERNFQTAIDTEAERKFFGDASYNSFNVALTRARYQAAVYTNSVLGLRQAIRSVEEKSSTIGNEIGRQLEKEQATIRQRQAGKRSKPGPVQPAPQPTPPPLQGPKTPGEGKELELELKR